MEISHRRAAIGMIAFLIVGIMIGIVIAKTTTIFLNEIVIIKDAEDRIVKWNNKYWKLNELEIKEK